MSEKTSKDIQKAIETSFRERCRKDKKLKNAYLLVKSEKLGVDLNIAEGNTNGITANIRQPNHMASVGKLFTAAMIGMLFDAGKLDYEDIAAKYLDAELMEGLHIYKGRSYSEEITIRHLLMQTSGLKDSFWPLLKKMINDPSYKPTVRDALIWGKENLKTKGAPGKKFYYTDTNYYLLGLIVEKITGKKFHRAMEEMIFEPLSMEGAYFHGYPRKKEEADAPTASLYIKGVDILSVEGVYEIDYAGGGVIAPLEDYLKFMKALVGEKMIQKETLERMINDNTPMLIPALGFEYGYSVWSTRKIPLLLPEKYSCWGCVGVTGAFMFYHPKTESYMIGTFNDFRYRGKALQFMLGKVVKSLLRNERRCGG